MDCITHCLSIREPYASLIVGRQKTIEFRTRKLIARPPETLAIATSKAGAGDFLPGGCIVGVARISAVVPWDDMNAGMRDRACISSPVGLGRGYAMMISSFTACEPVPVVGKVGLYRPPEGFAPVYGDSVEDLHRWWHDARVWRDGPADDNEGALVERMEAFGLGWRIDD